MINAELHISDLDEYFKQKSIYDTARFGWKYIEKFHSELYVYLKNKFDDISDSDSSKEIYFRIKHNLKKHPKCPICGAPLKFYSSRENSRYQVFCSRKCMNSKEGRKMSEKIKREKHIQKYGHDYKKNLAEFNEKRFKNKCPLADKEIREKGKKTCLERYGTEYPTSSNEIKNKIKTTCLERYGTTSPLSNKEIREKGKKTCLERYGTEYPCKCETVKEKTKQTNLKRYGAISGMKTAKVLNKNKNAQFNHYGTWYLSSKENKKFLETHTKEINLKRYNTKKKNHTFSTSKIEESFYKFLIEKYGQDDVIRQYKSVEYPFLCDFYVKSLNLYIEINAFWSHGRHPFNPLNEYDLKLVESWKSKNTKMYTKAIETWTIRDPKKLKVAKENHLNYLAIYSNNLDDCILQLENFLH